MFLLIDNYDSFTYNLVQYFQCLGEDPLVLKNDDPKILDLAKSGTLDKVVLSPGPSVPGKAGFCLDFLKLLPKTVPVLGVCLGHEILGLFAGAPVKVGPVIMHGMTSDITHNGRGLFDELPNPLRVGRYHSLVVVSDDDNPKPNFTVTARAPLGEVMALQYNDRPWVGVQFHPESVLTPDGMSLLANFPTKIMTPSTKIGAVPNTVREEHKMDTKIELRDIMDRLGNKEDLTEPMAKTAFEELFDGRLSPAQAGAFLMGLRAKGESPLELACAVRTALARAVKAEGVPDDAIDIVGTGGDGRSSFNCSTCAALTLAGSGYHVVKHGNRAVSSTSGTADALESLGIPLYKDPKDVMDYMHKTNFGFFFAPYAHPAFKNIGPVRRELGIRTLFNILGPMINPAKTPHLMMGVARPEMLSLVADTLIKAPYFTRACVLHGAGGYDEVTPMGPCKIILLDHGTQTSMELDPAKYGVETCSVEDLAVHTKEEAGAVCRELLQGRGNKHMLDMVGLNAGLAIFLVKSEATLDDCVAEGMAAVRAGNGRKFVNA